MSFQARNTSGEHLETADFIQLLLDAQREAMNGGSLDIKEHENKMNGTAAIEKKMNGTDRGLLDEEELVAQCVIFFLAGYETTASLLTFTCLCLAHQQDCQEKLYAELSSKFKDKSSIDYDTLVSLPYLDAVISESLRLFGPAPRIHREAAADYRLLGTDVLVRKGDIINIPVYAIHHCEEFYPQANRYNPDRWLAENREQINPICFLPFGQGPRICKSFHFYCNHWMTIFSLLIAIMRSGVGMRFAIVEAKLALARVLLKYKFVPSPKSQYPIVWQTTASPLLQAQSTMVGVERRQC